MKAKTPAYDTGSEDTGKHAKSEDSNLQPFMSGDESKPKRSEEEDSDRPKASEAGDFSAEGIRPPKTPEKGEKGEKKKKPEGEGTPGQ